MLQDDSTRAYQAQRTISWACLDALHQTHLVPTLVLAASTGQTTSCAASSCVHSNGGTRSAHLG
eukprot:5714245-Amphidinium_carterae.1